VSRIRHPCAFQAGIRAALYLAAVWEVPRIAAGEKQTYTLNLSGSTAQIYTLPGPSPSGQAFKGFEGSTVYWARPGVRMGLPLLSYRDLRLPDKGDHVAVSATAQ
jgi:hypothetical protein